MSASLQLCKIRNLRSFVKSDGKAKTSSGINRCPPFVSDMQWPMPG